MRFEPPKDRQSRQERRQQLLASITPEEQARLNPTPVYEWPAQDLDEAVAECKLSIEEAQHDNPDVGPDDVAHDVVMSYQMMLPGHQRRVFRERMGFFID